jgi:hypothetical protein
MTAKTFTTESGYVLRLKAVREPLVRARMRALEAEYRRDHPELEAPTYKAHTVAGDVYDIPLDEKSLDDPSDPMQTRINTARWNAHVKAKEEWAAIQTEQEYLSWLMLGVECDLPEGWEAEIEAVGVNLPTDPAQRKACWLHYMALSLADQQLLISELRVLAVGSVITDDQVESFRRSARSTLAREARARFDDAIQTLAEGPVVDRAAVPGADDGAGVEQDPERVGQVGQRG